MNNDYQSALQTCRIRATSEKNNLRQSWRQITQYRLVPAKEVPNDQ